jgi:hypothetical protein
MKKLLSIVCCSIILLSVSSCTKQYITPNPNQTLYADLASSDWTVYTDDAGNKAYQAPIDVAALAGDLAQIGGVVAAISYDGGTTYEQLPEVFNNVSFSYTYNKGNVTIYAQTANALPPATAIADPIKVKIILVDSN